MKYVLNGRQMKECDLSVIAGDINVSMRLIDKASSACIKHLYSNDFCLDNCLIVCGSGNNGADGFAIAEKLYNDGKKVTILLPSLNMSFSTEAEIIRKRILVNIVEYDSFITNYSVEDFTVIIDAIFGIGLSRDIDGKFLEVINLLNQSKKKVLSVDIPSGVSSENGCIMKVAVRADVTVTFGCLKQGQLLYPGKSYCGKIYVEDIGIPVIDSEKPNYCVTEVFDYHNHLPFRRPDGNKGTFGKILVVAGSKNIFGAAYLSAMAAYKCGCGMVHILTERHNIVSLQQMIPEAILHYYEEGDILDAVMKLNCLIDICDVVLIGCGLGIEATSVELVRNVIKCKKNMVIDADALNIISKHQMVEQLKETNTILTPHIKEMSRLSGIDCHDIKSNAINVARDFTQKNNVVLALKDAVTLVAGKCNNIYINNTGNNALAKAGSGDVLAGIIAGLLAQNNDLYESACLGVYIHGLIGDFKAQVIGQYSLLARNLLDGIEELIVD